MEIIKYELERRNKQLKDVQAQSTNGNDEIGDDKTAKTLKPKKFKVLLKKQNQLLRG
jgi:hypothetical protein